MVIGKYLIHWHVNNIISNSQNPGLLQSIF